MAMDLAAYNRCVDAHSDALFRFALKHLCDRDNAKDIVQDSFLRLWLKLDTVDEIKCRSYLFTTAHNLVVDRSRRRKFVTRYADGHENILVAHQPKHGLIDELNRMLDTLPPIQRSLVLLRDLEGFAYQEIADMTGLDMTKVKVYLFRARKALQGLIGDPALVA
jgi:RNA polymerase sigma-70 factor (ECF subfamily)